MLYKTIGKYDDQQQYKAMLEAAIISTPEGFTNQSPMTPKPLKKLVQDNNSVNFHRHWISNIRMIFVGWVNIRQSARISKQATCCGQKLQSAVVIQK